MLKQQNFFDRNIPAWKQVLFLSWPTIVELLLQTAINYVDTAMVGSIGVNATAAVSITMSTIWLINGFMNAVGIGYSVLAAHSIGEGNYEQAKVIIRQSILAIGVAGIFLTLIVTLFIAPNLPVWMHAEKEVVPLARSYLRIEAFAEPLLAIGVVLGGVLRGAGDTSWPFVISLLGMWVVRLPLAYTLIHLFDWGLAAVWGAAIADWAVRAAISCHRFYHKKWVTQKV